MRARRGFTLVELLVASGIFVLVIGGTLGAFVAVQRMTGSALAEAELSVGMRELREKLLFHAAPPHDGKIWSGVLSGVSAGAVVVNDRITMEGSWGYNLSQSLAVNQNIELSPSDRTIDGRTSRVFVNAGDTHDEDWSTRWLAPGKLTWLPTTDCLDDRLLAKGKVFYIRLESEARDRNGRLLAKRSERVTVPVFGREQRTFSGAKVFDDKLTE